MVSKSVESTVALLLQGKGLVIISYPKHRNLPASRKAEVISVYPFVIEFGPRKAHDGNIVSDRRSLQAAL